MPNYTVDNLKCCGNCIYRIYTDKCPHVDFSHTGGISAEDSNKKPQSSFSL